MQGGYQAFMQIELKQYANMIKNKAIINVVHKFYIIKDWLDDFYLKILN